MSKKCNFHKYLIKLDDSMNIKGSIYFHNNTYINFKNVYFKMGNSLYILY